MNLIHFTRSPESVVNILREGFAYVAWPTKAAKFVLPKLPPADREPQQFGMVSFRYESEEEISRTHREHYGEYGICVEAAWGIANGAQPVIYVEEGGSVALALRKLFDTARQSLDRECASHPDDSFRLLGYHNAAVAGVLGANEWALLLHIYQFVGPARDAKENEWRIVQQHPLYSLAKTSEAAVSQLSPAQGWAKVLNTVKITPDGVRFILVPNGCAEKLRSLLPLEFRRIEIREEQSV